MSVVLGVNEAQQELTEAVQHLQRVLTEAQPQILLRDEQADDKEPLVRLYAEFRAEELAQAPWPENVKQDFLAEQYRLQAAHYQAHYAGARFLVLVQEGVVIGRLYLYRSPSEYRLMDIMLFESSRRRGIGRVLISALCAIAGKQGVSITLHVERDNPARDFYLRRGFEMLEDRGVYHFMRFPSG
ncbi:MAG: GNAT family N-acetyltransferase [Ahniella sp.]|nr:GNAT family N-acetyltransferase [Ahniella sp.]